MPTGILEWLPGSRGKPTSFHLRRKGSEWKSLWWFPGIHFAVLSLKVKTAAVTISHHQGYGDHMTSFFQEFLKKKKQLKETRVFKKFSPSDKNQTNSASFRQFLLVQPPLSVRSPDLPVSGVVAPAVSIDAAKGNLSQNIRVGEGLPQRDGNHHLCFTSQLGWMGFAGWSWLRSWLGSWNGSWACLASRCSQIFRGGSGVDRCCSVVEFWEIPVGVVEQRSQGGEDFAVLSVYFGQNSGLGASACLWVHLQLFSPQLTGCGSLAAASPRSAAPPVLLALPWLPDLWVSEGKSLKTRLRFARII